MKNNYIGCALLDFPLKEGTLDEGALFQQTLLQLLHPPFGKLEKVMGSEVCPGNPAFGHYTLFSATSGLTAALRTYPSRSHVTLTLEYDLKDFGGEDPLKYPELKALEAELTAAFQASKLTKTLPLVKRALDFDLYFTMSDDRLLEYDIQEILLDRQSEFQHVQVGRSTNYGNLLILDDLVNLAEADLPYTEAIMCRGKVDYSGSDILILGGGDGALLHELRKEHARTITMIEIDEVVMTACRKYLRGACGDTLDRYKHENYEILLGDCLSFIAKCEAEGRTFHFIFGDLTDIPISLHGPVWDFLRQVLRGSFKILQPGGTYFTHANGISAADSLDLYERTVRESISVEVKMDKTYAFVPSFKEKWVFYQIQRL